ncbi:hypothetical protein AB3X91_20160 [Paraburkholderia sp. BR14263]|uniref:hypothetical protein n=1 Tax=unclassified Paraburkholderia TaxID=2615204 RepID=UPI0034CD6A50
MNAYELDVWSLRKRFDTALEDVEMRSKAIEDAKNARAPDPYQIERAESAYRRSMLLYLSCELDLRRVAITHRSRSRSACRVLLYCRQNGIQASLEALLRVRGYDITVTATLAAIKTEKSKRTHSVVVAYVPPGKSGHTHFVDLIVQAALPLSVLVVTDAVPTVPVPQEPSALDGNGPTFRTVSVHSLVSELDQLLGLPAAETSKPFEDPSIGRDRSPLFRERAPVHQ